MSNDTQTIRDLETRFWQCMVDKDAETSGAMLAGESLAIGPRGAMRLDPVKWEAMTKDGDWKLNSFEFSEVDVFFPSDDTAVIAYKVHQIGTMKDEEMDLTCADSSTWVREDGDWKVALHTETVLHG